MTGSPSAAHPADLAGLCPGINENGAGVWADGRETQSPGARRWYRRPRDQCAPKGRFLNALFFRALRRGQRKRGGAPGTVIAYYILREGGVYAPRAMRGLPRTPRSGTYGAGVSAAPPEVGMRSGTAARVRRNSAFDRCRAPPPTRTRGRSCKCAETGSYFQRQNDRSLRCQCANQRCVRK